MALSAIFAPVIASAATLAVVIASFAIFAVVTALFAKSIVAIVPSAIFTEVTAPSFMSDVLISCVLAYCVEYKTCVWLLLRSTARIEEPAAYTA